MHAALLRFDDGIFGGQAVSVDTLVKQRGPDAAKIGPLLQRLSLSQCVYPAGASGIAHLLLVCGPAAVTRLVVTVVVDAVNAVSQAWTRPHVVRKGTEVSQPPLADLDAAPAIESVGLVGRVSAAADHVIPSPVNRVFGYIAARPHNTPNGTAAGSRVGASKVAGAGLDFSATLTFASPKNDGLTAVEPPFQVSRSLSAARTAGRSDQAHVAPVFHLS